MNRLIIVVVVVASFGVGAFAQSSAAPPAAAGNGTASANGETIHGCLDGERGNYLVVEDNGSVYVLRGVGNKLDSYLHHEVEVKGKILPGTIKTGTRQEKAGSNPSDTVHGVDGVPFRVANVQTDVRTVSKKCKAADQQ
jgi:hypothetical protein